MKIEKNKQKKLLVSLFPQNFISLILDVSEPSFDIYGTVYILSNFELTLWCAATSDELFAGNGVKLADITLYINPELTYLI